MESDTSFKGLLRCSQCKFRLYRLKSFSASDRGKCVIVKEDILHDENKIKLSRNQFTLLLLKIDFRGIFDCFNDLYEPEFDQ